MTMLAVLLECRQDGTRVDVHSKEEPRRIGAMPCVYIARETLKNGKNTIIISLEVSNRLPE